MQASSQTRIGLALSGGGFRASIFHLGAIRRLEELGIMPDVEAVSAVSGGSIVAAYYVCEMERRLRNLPASLRGSTARRLQIFEEIAADFLAIVDRNLRSRALIFTPYYHPFLFLKTLFVRAFRRGARSELMEREYDKYFYHGATLDELPSVTPAGSPAASGPGVYGPKVILNTTSLLTGERVSFSREPVSRFNELSKVNRNVLPLARVVGASAGVPVLFPPTTILGDMLVDGGVSDNQGIQALLESGSCPEVLLVSDASGQLEPKDRIGTGEAAVFGRINSILQHQLRSKLISLLQAKKQAGDIKAFAFIHLFLNLKDRADVQHRVSSEMIQFLARIRTDLDQFSYVEREALMYHGYTLMDAQIRLHCPHILAGRPGAPMRHAPLFRDDVLRSERARAAMARDLAAGCEGMYLVRCLEKYGLETSLWLLAGAVAAAAIFVGLMRVRWPFLAAIDLLTNLFYGFIPAFLRPAIDWMLMHAGGFDLHGAIRGISGLLAVSATLAVSVYLPLFAVYNIVRRRTLARDRRTYRLITGEDPSVSWGGKEEQKAAAIGRE